MLLREIRELTDAEVLTGQDMIDTYTVKSVYASDLMSDVLAQVKGHPLLITGLCNPQVMRTAEMMDISCVLFVRALPLWLYIFAPQSAQNIKPVKGFAVPMVSVLRIVFRKV